ncbi:TPA: hypothetical protein ACQIUU_003938 [Escherichia coli]
MSKITRERAAKIAAGGGYNFDEVEELARIALASLEAEPVGTFRKGPCGYSPSFHEDAMPLYAAPPAPVVPAELHPDTLKLVTDFSSALAEKLYKAQLKYGYDADWKQDGWPSQCQADFQQHIAKGDPRDVAAYCAFMWYHGWKTEPAPVSLPDEQHSERFNWTLGQWAEHVGGHYQGNDPANYYEFGSFMAVAAMLCQFGTVQQKIGWNACRAAMVNAGQ